MQTLAGVLLPSATVFLLLLCNDKAVLGPWVNGRGMNLFTGAVIAVLVMLSVILTVSVLFPDIANERFIVGILAGGSVLAVIVAVLAGTFKRGSTAARCDQAFAGETQRNGWRMPPLHRLPPLQLSRASQIWMVMLRLYLLMAGGLVIARIIALALGHS